MTANNGFTVGGGFLNPPIPNQDEIWVSSVIVESSGDDLFVVTVSGKTEGVGDKRKTVAVVSAARISPEGAIESSFGVDGSKDLLTIELDGIPLGRKIEARFLDDGQLHVAFSGSQGGREGIFSARFDNELNSVEAYGDFGIAVVNSELSDDFSNYTELSGIYISGAGKVFAAGSTSGGAEFLSLDANGELDQSFGEFGRADVRLSKNVQYLRYLSDLERSPDGDLIAVGYAGREYKYHPIIFSVGMDGSLNNDFGDDGYTSLEGLARGGFFELEVLPSGDIFAGGIGGYWSRYPQTFGRNTLVAKFTDDGTLDASFAGNGYGVLNTGNYYQQFSGMEVDDEGIILSGSYWENGADQGGIYLWSITLDGYLTPSFADYSVLNYGLQKIKTGDRLSWSRHDTSRGVTVSSENEILLVGSLNESITVSNPVVVRLSENGFIDPAFGSPKTIVVNELEYTENRKILIDSYVTAYVETYAKSDNYVGTKFSISRPSEAHANDKFWFASDRILVDDVSGLLAVDGVAVAVLHASGERELVLEFLDGARQHHLSHILSNIYYENLSDDPLPEYFLRWQIATPDPSNPSENVFSEAFTTVLVLEDNDAPVSVGSLEDIVVRPGEAFEYPVGQGFFSDPDDSALRYDLSLRSVGILPPWIRFASESGVMFGTVPDQALGTYDLQVTAADPSSLSATHTFSLSINGFPSGALDVEGESVEGMLLSAIPQFSDPEGVGPIVFEWSRGSTLVATGGDRYTLTQGDVGHEMSVTAKYTDGAGMTESIRSSLSLPVVNVNDSPKGTVSINGSLVEGETLSVTVALNDEDGLGVLSYQWMMSGVDIAGATADNYMLTGEDVDGAISVRVSYIDGFGTVESFVSGNIGDDLLIVDIGNTVVNGGDGLDTARVPLFVTEFSLQENAPGKFSGTFGKSSIELNDVEFIEFGTTEFKTTVAIEEVVTGRAQEQFEKLSDLYAAFFGRSPEFLGLEFWAEQLLEKGMDFTEISKFFATSEEAQRLYPDGVSSEEFVRTVYQNALNREPDQSGFDFWVGILDSVDASDLSVRGEFVGNVILSSYSESSGPRDRDFLANRHELSLDYLNRLIVQPEEGFDQAGIDALRLLVTDDDATLATAEELLGYVFDDPITLTGVMTDQGVVDSYFG